MPIKLTKAESGRLEFENGAIVVTDYHSQDCCENVYADFTQLADKIGQEFVDYHIDPVPGAGFRIGGEFVPCYNEQNGYYSSNLSIQIDYVPLDHQQEIDISDCVEDRIY